MKTEGRPVFDIDALRGHAGETVFARGEEYFLGDQVSILAIEPGRVLAQVEGSEDYRTELTGGGKRVGGACSCPAFSDWGFCKHMVAVALAANAAGGDAGAQEVGALSRIRDHLKGKGVDALVEMIVEMAERDPALFRRLDMAAATLGTDDKTLEARLRKAIDEATRTRGFVDYREAAGWAEGVYSALDTVADLSSGRRAGLALKLVERAIDWIERAIEEVDDSDGHCGGLLERAQEIHLAACRAAKPDRVKLARDLFTHEMEADYDTFHRAATLYADVLGKEGLAEYRRLATAAWEKLPPRAGRDDFSTDYTRLEGMLDIFAEQDGDVETRIALRSKDLSSPWSYLRLAEFLLSQGREEEALRRAEEGLWVFEDDRLDERLVFFAAELLSKAGRKGDAEALLWRAFEKAPSLELYARIRKTAGKHPRGRAVEFLEARLANGERTRWQSPGDLLIRILMHEKAFDAAWAAVRRYGASLGVKEGLARASEAMHPREAIEVYTERVNQLADAGGNPAYAEAARLVAHMGTLQSATAQTAYVAELKARFGRKRNFVKALA